MPDELLEQVGEFDENLNYFFEAYFPKFKHKDQFKNGRENSWWI